MEHLSLSGQPNRNVVYLELDDAIDDPNLRRFAGCLRELRPAIIDCGEFYGHGITMAALVSIVANSAIEHDVAALIADALRQNAEMLESQTPDRLPNARDRRIERK